MAYYLGIDLGTTYTAAAVWRDGRVEIANLGTRAPVVPSVVLLRDDGTVLTGEAAARRAVTEPQRIAREFKRRFGDPTPIIIGGTPYSADALTARMLRWVVDTVAEREGGPPTGIVVAHPANWGPYKQDLFQQVFRLADLAGIGPGGVTTLSEPEAAAIHYASQERVDPGAVVAVYDLGGGTFDAAVLRRTESGWQILGEPEGVERLGGVDFDQAVFHHVTTAIGDAVERLDDADASALAAVARLRQECVEAKEALAADVDVTIPVLLPTLQTEVRLTRGEFEAMIRPALADSIGALRRALSSAGVEPEEVSAVLLVGGSSRLPLVAQLVGSELRRPVAVDAHPKHGVALGAAITAAERGTGRTVDTEVVPSIETITPEGQPLAATAANGGAAVAGAAVPGPGATGAVAGPGAVGAGAGAAAAAVAAAAGAGGAGTPAAGVTAAAGGTAAHAGGSATSPLDRGEAAAAGVGGAPAARSAPAPDVGAGASEAAGSTTEPPSVAAHTGTGSTTTGQPGTAPTQRAYVPAPPRSGKSSSTGRAPTPPPPPARPTRSNGGSQPPKSRGALALTIGLLAAAALVAVGVLLWPDNDDDPGQTASGDDQQGQTETTDGTEPRASTTQPTTSTTQATPAGPFVTLEAVTIVQEGGDDLFQVSYRVSGFDPLVDGDPEDLHIHFFLDTTEPENAGTNGDPPGLWDLTDETNTFVITAFTPAEQGAATEMCTVVATVDHGVHDPDSGTCIPLPD